MSASGPAFPRGCHVLTGWLAKFAVGDHPTPQRHRSGCTTAAHALLFSLGTVAFTSTEHKRTETQSHLLAISLRQRPRQRHSGAFPKGSLSDAGLP